MICERCAFGADVMTDYREDAAQRIERGENPNKMPRWLRRRAGYALALHCRGSSVGCTCQHRIRELS